ncbi:NFACT family protein [Virgibacillus soli]|uniref:Rqc2 homolog RqcH n=1 Tax=Paracerasibacillus soli TaxID=480284 RepID=A0ABU5CP34_9BACI|nr:NFACT RNA binding domain-containing protein [Virgibacillus soli]MDY0408124.1 NFACT RNA binding domain-containing protein [Virgibacillus soli]
MPFDGVVTKAVTEELNEQLLQGRITKIYQPTQTELILTIRNKGKNTDLLLSIHPVYTRMHITNEKYINPQEPPMFCMVLRKYLLGAFIEFIEQDGFERVVTIGLRARNELGDTTILQLTIELMGKHSNIILIDVSKNVIIDSMKRISAAKNRYRTILPGATYITPPKQNKLDPLQADSEQFVKKLDFNAGKLSVQIVQALAGVSPFIAKEIVHRAQLGSVQAYQDAFQSFQQDLKDKKYEPAIYKINGREDFHVIPLTDEHSSFSFSSTNVMLEHFYTGKAERDRVQQRAKDLYRFIKNELDKNVRKLKKHERTIKKSENANHYQKLGELLTAHMHLVKKGDHEVTVTDYYDPEQRQLTISLNPNKMPSENAQDLFRTYQKLKNSRHMMEQEIAKTNIEISYLDQLLQQIDVAKEEDLEEIREELREQGYLKKQYAKRRKTNAKPKIESYVATDGTVIYVGKNNKQNEYLTTKFARRNDIWLHTKDIPGSHVVIRHDNPSEEVILEAAHIAAYFSKSRESSSVPVDYTKVRHVQKPKGAKPGFVIYTNQKTVFVTPEQSIVQKLKK